MRLTDCFMELVAYVVYFLKTVSIKQPSFDKVKADIQRLISEGERCIDRGPFSREDFDLARFAVFSWIDEAIMNSAWAEKNRWLGERLQRVYYGTANAGELFYERLNSIGLHQRDVREVYYLCLAMGFKGLYCLDGQDYLLDQLKASNLKLLTGSSLGVPSLEKDALFPEAYSAKLSKEPPPSDQNWLSPFTLFFLGFPLLVLIALFFLYRFILSNRVEDLISMVPK